MPTPWPLGAGLRGVVYQEGPAGKLRPPIAGAKLTFVRDDGWHTNTTTASTRGPARGSYSVVLPAGEYWVRVADAAHEDYCSFPTMMRVIAYKFSTVDFYLRPPRATTVLLLRHADRDGEDLNQAGWVRATNLLATVRRAGISAIYVTAVPRTADTARPLADFLKLGFQQYSAANSLLQDVTNQHRGDTVLVVGHSGMLVGIAQQFGAGLPDDPNFPDDFDNLLVVSRLCDSEATQPRANVVNLQYGADSNPNDLNEVPVSAYAATTLLLVRTHPARVSPVVDKRSEALARAVQKALARPGGQPVETLLFAPQLRWVQQYDGGLVLQPLADQWGLPIHRYGSGAIRQFTQSIAPTGQLLVVAGDATQLQAVVRELGGTPNPSAEASAVDDLLLVTVLSPGKAKVVNLQYGTTSPAR